MKIDIIPGILEQEWAEIEKRIEKVKSFTKVIHIDLIDGKFTDNKTFLDPEPFKKYSDDIYFELHMMVEDPIKYLKPFANAGFKRFLGHVEKMPDQAAFVAQGQILGEVGLALDGQTPISTINIPFNDLDSILIYTSDRVGFSGPKLNPQRLEKIKELKEKTQIPIEADGGINDETIRATFDAGATRFVATSFIHNQANPLEQFNILQRKLGLTE